MIRKFAMTGCLAILKSTRVPRQAVVDSLGAVGVETVPPIDHYAALLATGNCIVTQCAVAVPGGPQVRSDSLSRSAVGVEFFLTTKGDKKNERDFLFSIGVDKTNKAFVKDVGNHPNVVSVLRHPNADDAVDQVYQANLLYMPARDVTESVTSVIMANRAVRLADGKGVYFVPEPGLPAVRSVFSDLNNHGCGYSLWANDLADPEIQKQVLDATKEQLCTDLAAMQEEMQAILSDPKKKPRINGLKTKMAELSRHANLCDYYKSAFGGGLEVAEESLAVTCQMLAELQIRYGGEK